MHASINIQMIPTPLMWETTQNNVVAPGIQDEAGQNIEDESGSTLQNN